MLVLRRLPLLAAVAGLPLGGCVVGTVAGAAVGVAAVTAKTGVKVAGATAKTAVRATGAVVHAAGGGERKPPPDPR